MNPIDVLNRNKINLLIVLFVSLLFVFANTATVHAWPSSSWYETKVSTDGGKTWSTEWTGYEWKKIESSTIKTIMFKMRALRYKHSGHWYEPMSVKVKVNDVEVYDAGGPQGQWTFSTSKYGTGKHTIKIQYESETTYGTLPITTIRNIVYDQYWLSVADNIVPKVSLNTPQVSTRTSKTTKFKVSWKGSDSGSGIASYDVQYKVAGKGWQNWKPSITKRATNFKGQQGKTYYFRARARDKAGNVSKYSKAKRTIVPYDNNSRIRSRIGFGRTFKKASSRFYKGTIRYSTNAGDYITYRFYGRYLYLIATKARYRSKAQIYLDGKYIRTINTNSQRSRYRRVVFKKTWRKIGYHTIKIVNVGNKRRLDLDALAVGR